MSMSRLIEALFIKADSVEKFGDRLFRLLGHADYNAISMYISLVGSVKDDSIYSALSQFHVRNRNSVIFSVSKLNRLLDELSVSFDDRILDFHGGNGLMGALIANQYNVKCVDVCDFHDGDQLIKGASDKIRYSQMPPDYYKLPYGNNTFDIISCFMVPHIVDKEMINQLHRVSKKWLVVYEYSDSEQSKQLVKLLSMMNKHVYKFTDECEYPLNNWGELTKGKFILTKKYKTLSYPIPVFVYIYKKVEELYIDVELQEKLNKFFMSIKLEGNWHENKSNS